MREAAAIVANFTLDRPDFTMVNIQSLTRTNMDIS